MKQKNGRLIVLVAAIAVAAVVTGGVIAAQRGPHAGEGGSAAPLAGPTTTPVAETPSSTPSSLPPKPSAGSPVKVALKLSKLTKGRDPQVAYLVGREVRGGAGDKVKIPGTQQIQQVARLGDAVLAVVTKGYGTELLKVGYEAVEHTPDVTTLVTTTDGSQAAYATKRIDTGGGVKGSTVYATTTEGGLDAVKKLALPNRWEVRVIAYQGGKVYFSSFETQNSSTWQLSAWDPAKTTATEVKTITSPTALAGNGEVAAALTVLNDNGTCSAVIEVATGKQFWRTCDYQVKSFTADGRTAIGGPRISDGYADLIAAALDARTGSLLREWSGPSFRQTVAEDDQHLLILADDGPDTKASIIRCTITNGACELATPLAAGELMIGS
ncbi:hypothetical protein F1D05_23690 [Kribbella qitaiheensis]|uniref:PQQ-binding-like beta-propeller repeat protein n=1 Tax=Kribbella qitaiheensis TaxID=1544730 RepID=A0A7G6X294_9ACTN|nr:hypothetical protein [Kribbella qitaiheensis]QNE20359.1 hypothetical protein F1D05_23690 [Kribbella qitaiheensis]